MTEASRQSSEFPSALQIIRTTREAPPAPIPIDPTAASSHLQTPPITPAVSGGKQRRRLLHDDSPHPSVETTNTTFAPLETLSPQRSLQPRTDSRTRRRERSPTAFAVYNPHLPTHRDGTLDENSIKAWKDGVEYVKGKMNDFNCSLRQQQWEHPKATIEEQNAALVISYKVRGLDEFLPFLEKDQQKHEKRLNEFKASRAALGALNERRVSRTVST